MNKNRCSWAVISDSMRHYHDTEWGVPVHNDKKLFEFLILDAFQAGLSWQIVLNKRENFRVAFDGFNADKIAKYKDKKVEELVLDAGIIRNRQKINACIVNAQLFIEIQTEFGSFDKYIWQFTNHKTIINEYKIWKDIPSKTKESDAMSLDLKKRGFKFVGSTICYAFMQAAGMVNDHEISCFRYNEILRIM